MRKKFKNVMIVLGKSEDGYKFVVDFIIYKIIIKFEDNNKICYNSL